MTNNRLLKVKNLLFSLRVRFIIVFFLAVGLGVGLYFLSNTLAFHYIDTVYMDEENKKERERGYLEDLQNFINSNGITPDTMGKISSWAKENQYVYLLISNSSKEIVFTSDDVEDEKENGGVEQGKENEKLPPENDQEAEKEPDNKGENSNSESTDGEKDKADKEENPGFTLQYPSRDELLLYAQKNGMHLIEFADKTPFNAGFAEFTEYLYYDISNIVSLVIAAIAIVITLLVYIHNVTSRIIRLGNDVNRIADGESNHKIKSKGNDEIAELAENVDGMRNSLITAVKKERESIKSNSELITSMSHDIRTPLTVLLGYIDVMRAHSQNDEEMQKYINAAESTAMRLKKLSDDMFNYFLVFGGKETEVDFAEFDAFTLVEQMLSEHILLLKENGYAVEVTELGEKKESCVLRTDAQKLVRIFDNIFSNIYKYAKKEEAIAVVILTDPCQISVKISNVTRDDSERVESNGIGLKTCEKLAEIIGSKIEHGTTDNGYFVNLTLPLKN